jgi:hypothetical protein
MWHPLAFLQVWLTAAGALGSLGAAPANITFSVPMTLASANVTTVSIGGVSVQQCLGHIALVLHRPSCAPMKIPDTNISGSALACRASTSPSLAAASASLVMPT